MNRSKSLAMMFLFGALLVGGAMGFAADRVIMKDRLCTEQPDRLTARQKLADYLGLDSAQRLQFDTILDRRHRAMTAALSEVRPRIDSLERSVKPRLDSILAGSREEMRRVLTAEQRPLFERRLEEQRLKRDEERRRNEEQKQQGKAR
jgi:hypothetical protein